MEMQCKECNTEMLVDKVEITEDTEVFTYKCRNKNCSKYGYKEETIEK